MQTVRGDSVLRTPTRPSGPLAFGYTVMRGVGTVIVERQIPRMPFEYAKRGS